MFRAFLYNAEIHDERLYVPYEARLLTETVAKLLASEVIDLSSVHSC